MPSLQQKIQTKQQKRGERIEEAGQILGREEEEDRNLSDEERKRFEALHSEADDLKKEIKALKRQRDAEEELAETPEPRSGRPNPAGETPEGGEEEEAGPEYRDVFWQAFRHGVSRLDGEARQMLERRSASIDLEDAEFLSDDVQRALTTGTGSSGGFTVPEDFADELTSAEKQFGGMRRSRAQIINTDNGRDLPWPSSDDTGNKGSLLSENTQVNETDATFSQVVFGSFTYSSDIVRVPRQLLTDSAFNLEEWLSMKLGERIGRIENEHFTTGSGSGQPNGVVTASTKAADAANAATLTYDDFVNLQHGPDPAYRENAEFMMHDDGVKEARLIKDGNGNPIWQPGLADEARDTILGDPYVVNNDMPSPGTSNKSVLYGDFQYYKIRDVMGTSVLVLRERYADFFQIGVVAFARRDGDLVDPGNGPIQHLLHP